MALSDNYLSCVLLSFYGEVHTRGLPQARAGDWRAMAGSLSGGAVIVELFACPSLLTRAKGIAQLR